MAQKKVLILDKTKTQINPSSEESVILLRKIVQLLQSSAIADPKQRQRVTIDALQSNAAGGVTELSATIPVSSTPVAGAVNTGNVVIQLGPQATAAGSGVDSTFLLINTARNAYANGVRSKLSWS